MTRAICPHCNEGFNDTGDAFCPICHENLSEPVEDTQFENVFEDQFLDEETQVYLNDALGLAQHGYGKQTIVKHLLELGADEETALKVASHATAVEDIQRGRQGTVSLILGVAVLCIGLFVTFGSMMITGQRGGQFVVTYGLILSGIFLIGRGLYQMGIGKKSEG